MTPELLKLAQETYRMEVAKAKAPKAVYLKPEDKERLLKAQPAKWRKVLHWIPQNNNQKIN